MKYVPSMQHTWPLPIRQFIADMQHSPRTDDIFTLAQMKHDFYLSQTPEEYREYLKGL